MKYLIDTDWVIDHLNGAQEVIRKFEDSIQSVVRDGHSKTLSKNSFKTCITILTNIHTLSFSVGKIEERI